MRRLCLALAVCVALVAACGDDESADTTTTLSTTTTTTPTTTTTSTTSSTTTTTTSTTTTTTTIPAESSEYAGEWVGQTSQGQGLVFMIGEYGGFLQFMVAWSGTECDDYSPMGIMTASPREFVTGAVISVEFVGLVVIVFEGSFTSPNSASGTLEIGGAGCGDGLTLDWWANR